MSFSSKNLRELNPWADLWWKHVVIAAADELDRLNAENARLREALERIARHDSQAIALDALAPGERIRAVDMKIVDEKPDLPRSISFQVGELGVSRTEEKP